MQRREISKQDQQIIENLIHEIFRAHRMGAHKTKMTKLAVIREVYGADMERSIRRTLRSDTYYLKRFRSSSPVGKVS